MKKLLALLLASVMVFGLVACGSDNKEETKKETEKQTEANDKEETKDEAVDGADLKVAILLSGAINDMGWNQTAYEGFLEAAEEYGFETAYSENLAPADIAAAFADYAAAGYDVVIGHGYEFGDPAMEVADQYPDCKFIITEANVEADNVASYVMACEETAYVEGVIAASITESNKLGHVAPLQGGSLIKIVNGFEDGAKSVNPDIEYYAAWTNDFVDTQLALEAANAMIEKGADVIKHCANACGTGAINAAVAADIYCMGDSYDQSSLAPENMLDSAIYNLNVVMLTAMGDVVSGEFEGGIFNLGMAEGAVELMMYDLLPDDVKAIAEDTIAKIKSGEIEVVCDEVCRQN